MAPTQEGERLQKASSRMIRATKSREDAQLMLSTHVRCLAIALVTCTGGDPKMLEALRKAAAKLLRDDTEKIFHEAAGLVGAMQGAGQ